MTVEITLTTIQVDATVFDLYSNIDGYTTPFETNVSAASLQAGYTTGLVPDGTTSIRVQSVSASCTNYIDLVLVTTTTTTSSTTTSTTTFATVECNASTNSGGVGVTEYAFELSSLGGVIILDFNAQSVPDKLEILHNGARVATSGMTATNAGPFDTLYGDPTVPTTAQASATDQFIGSSKGVINTRNAEFLADTGLAGVTANRQQLVWFQYDNADFLVDPFVVARITGPIGTAWNLDRVCLPSVLVTDVIFNTGDNPTDLWQYNPDTQLETYLFGAGVPSSDVAHTQNKLWLFNSAAPELLEYDIELNPWQYVYNRTITNIFGDSGLCAIDDVTLVNVDGGDVYSIDITTTVAAPTFKFSMESGRGILGDYVYTVGGKLIVLAFNGPSRYITQYDWATGTLEFDLDITATVSAAYGLYQYNGGVYIANSNGNLYNILTDAPYTLSLVDTTSFTINGASQVPSAITEEFTSNTTTTTTSTTSTTTTTTSTSSTTTTTTTIAPTTTTTTTVSAGYAESSISTTSHVSDACGETVNNVVYINTGGDALAAGDLVYTDPGGSTLFVGDGNYYAIEDVFTTDLVSARINASGEILAPLDVCVVPPTTTTTTTTVSPITEVSLSNSSVSPDCGLSVVTGYYTEKAGSVIANGDIIYDDAGATSPVEGNGNYYRMYDVDAAVYVTGTIDVSGVVANASLCP